MSNLVSDTPFDGMGRSNMLTDHGAGSPLIMEGYDRLADRIVRDGVKTALDWGCGFAHLTRRLLDQGVETEAFDFIPGLKQPSAVTSTAYPEITVHVSPDPVALPYASGSFDAVVSLGTLEHVSDPGASLREIGRVLAPGGMLYVSRLPNKDSYIEFVARHTGRYYHGALEHDRVYSLSQAKALLTSNGFAVREARHWDMLPLTSLGRRLGPTGRRAVRFSNAWLSRVPMLNILSTNLELVAVRQGIERDR